MVNSKIFPLNLKNIRTGLEKIDQPVPKLSHVLGELFPNYTDSLRHKTFIYELVEDIQWHYKINKLCNDHFVYIKCLFLNTFLVLLGKNKLVYNIFHTYDNQLVYDKSMLRHRK